MDREGFIVDGDYNGFVFVGWASGLFEIEPGRKQPYFNMYVISPVSDYQSDDYMAFGYKAEKMKCVSSDVWSGINPGDKVRLYFDARGRVVKADLYD